MNRRTSQHARAALMSLPRALGIAGVALAVAAAHAQTVDVRIDFRDSGIAEADRPAFINKLQMLFTNAGLGPAAAMGVRVQEGMGMGDIRCGFGMGGGELGISDKRGRLAAIDPTAINNFLGAGADAERRCRAYADVMAHEIGHTLCGTHVCSGGGRKRMTVRNNMGVLEQRLVACGGMATILSDGPCVLPGELGTNMLGFADATLRQMRMGIRDFGNANRRDMRAPFQPGILCLVAGQLDRTPGPTDQDRYYNWDDDISFQYATQGRTDLFEVGYLNLEGEFNLPLNGLDNPDSVLDAKGGDPLHFALRGLPGSGFDGQVFPQAMFGELELAGYVNSAGDAAIPASLGGSYYSQVEVAFHIAGNEVDLLLDTGTFGGSNGFYIIPSPATAGAFGMAFGFVSVSRRRRGQM